MQENEFHKITPQVSIAITEGCIKVHTVYTPNVPSKFRDIGGEFEKSTKVWWLPMGPEAIELLDELYGIQIDGDNPTMLVRVDNRYLMVNVGFDTHKSAMLGGYILAHRGHPDWSVKMCKGVKKIAGEFARNHPQGNLDPHPSTVVEIEVTKRFAERLGLDKPLEERASTIRAFTDQELLAEVERRGLVMIPSNVAAVSEDDDDLPF